MTRQLALFISLLSPAALAGSFGVYDARSQAMGTAAVAVGDVGMATGHNPALLGLFDEDEDKSRNGKYLLPSAIGSYNESASYAYKLFERDKLDSAFADALDGYNQPIGTPENFDMLSDDQKGQIETQLRQYWAGIAGSAAEELEDALIKVANKDIRAQGFASLIAVSEPGELGGGGFYLASRVEVGGRSFIPDEDITLAHQYVEALNNVATGARWDAVNPDLFNTLDGYDGDVPPPLRDPYDIVTSNAIIHRLHISEVAVAGAKGFEFESMRVAIGATPKVAQVRVVDESRKVSNDDFQVQDTSRPYLTFNVDVGIAIHFDSGFRLGYVGKDLINRSYTTDIGYEVQLNSKHRLGLAYIKPRWQIGMDYDMKPNSPVSAELAGQFLALGGEVSILKGLHLRAGYQYDTEGNVPSTTSLGLGITLGRIEGNLSYEQSEESEGAGINLGYFF